MQKNNSTSADQSLNIANVLLSANWQKVTESDYGCFVFTPEYFATGWNSIYVNPSDLKVERVSVGMRKLVAPTLLITSEQSKMAYVRASEEIPVYIQSEYRRNNDFGYLMAFAISPEISPEYIFYSCKFNLWKQLLSRIGADDSCLSWNDVGIVENDSLHGDLKHTPEDIIRSLGEIVIPTRAQQEILVKSAREQEVVVEETRYDVTELVDRYLMFSNNFLNKSGLLGLLTETYRIAAGNRVRQDVLNILNQYEFKRDILTQEELNFLSKHLKELFAKVVFSNDGLAQPQEVTAQPQEVTDFMCKMASFPENVTVYNPFAGTNSYAIALPNPVVGEELNQTTWALGQIGLFANFADKRADIALADSFERMKTNEKFSAIIASPVYLHEENKEISDIVRVLYDKLADGGKLACIVSAEFLFRKDSRVRPIREKLIEEKAISKVVMLPSDIFTGSSAAQAVIVLTKGVENKEIHFGDASGHTRFAKNAYRTTTFDLEDFMEAFHDDIVDTQEGYEPSEDQAGAAVPYANLVGSDLTPSLYLTPKPENGIPLSVLVEEIQGLGRSKDIFAEYFITGSSIPAAMHRKPYIPTKVEGGKVSTGKKQIQVSENAVILAIANGNIRTVYTEGFTGKIAFPSDFVKVFRPVEESISAKYLAAVLSTKIVADQIKAQTTGENIPRLNRLDLRQIIVPVPETAEEREQLISYVLSSEMGNLEEELQKTLDSQKREVRSIRHAMIQTLFALSSNWEVFKMFAEQHKEGIKPTDIIGRNNPITVENLMKSIEYAVSTLQRQVESLRFEKSDWGKDAEINPYKFINEYIDNHADPSVRMVYLGNDNVADIPDIDDKTGDIKYVHDDAVNIFYAPEKLLERIFNNIVANAKAHGFTPDSTNNEIRFDWTSENGGIVITIANNGRPLKSGVSGEDVLMSGFSTALNEDAADGTLHSGQGGFEIKSLMEGLGTVEVISQPEAEFPVIYKLTFEKTNCETIFEF